MKNKKGSRQNRNKAAAGCGGEVASTGGGKGAGLSMLPDDVLINILERVDTLDALRTCILSKRMLKLSTMLSRFDINISNLVRHHPATSHYTSFHVAQYNDAVANVTEKILSARNREISISKLRVRLYLRRYECLSISKAVARTMATQKVDDAQFVLITEKVCGDCSDTDLLCFARRFKTCLGDCPAAFSGLTRLWLHNMRFDESDIPNILSNCKRLESLHLTCCDAGVRSVLQVEHPQLVELLIDYGKFEAVVLNCLPKLQHISYNGWSYQDLLSFRSVPQLSKLSLAKMGINLTRNIELSQFLADVPSITDLHLDFRSEKIWVLPEHPKLLVPVLGKLRIVNLVNLSEGCDISWTMFFLEAAPSLKELGLSVRDHLCYKVTDKNFRREHGYCEKANVKWQPAAFDFKHKNLVKLTIYGFQPNENFVQYVRRVMEVAVNIREIFLHDREVCESCGNLDAKIKINVCPSRYPRTCEEKDMLREKITGELGMAYPRTCEEKDMLREKITGELGMASTAAIHFRS